jgi:hypothetical protein
VTLLVAALLVGLQTLAVGFVAVRIGRWALSPTDSSALRITAVLTAAFGQVVVVSTLLGAFGLFRRWPIALAHALIAAFVVLRDRTNEEPSDGGNVVTAGAGWITVAFGALTGAVVSLYYLIGFRATTREFDTLNYKVPNLAHMMLRHDTWSLAFANIGYFTNLYPSNHVLLSGFLALPFGTDAPGYLVNLAPLALLLASVAALAETVGGSAISGAALGAAVALAPIGLLTQAGSLQDDLAAAAAIAAAAGLLLAVRSARYPLRVALLGGVALGVGAGTKYTAYLPAAAVLILGVVAAPRVVRWKVAAAAAAGALATSAFWLLRNLVQLHNPLSPLGVGPLRGVESPLQRYETSLLSHVVHLHTGPLHTWLSLGWRLVGIAAVVPLVGAAVALARGRRQPLAAGLAATAAFAVVAYMATPYTGGGSQGAAFLIGSQLRYAFPALALAAGATASFMSRRFALGTAVASLVYSAWRLYDRDPARPDVHLGGRWVLVIVAALCGAGVVAGLARRPRRWPPTMARIVPVAVLVGVTAVVGLAGTATPRSSPTLDAALTRLGVPRGPVVVVDVRDVRAILGPCLLTAPVGPKLGRYGSRLPPTPAQLDRAVNALDASVLAVGHTRGPTLPADWTSPPGWTKVAADRGIDLYARPGVTLPASPPKATAPCALRKTP